MNTLSDEKRRRYGENGYVYKEGSVKKFIQDVLDELSDLDEFPVMKIAIEEKAGERFQ